MEVGGKEQRLNPQEASGIPKKLITATSSSVSLHFHLDDE